MKRVLLILFAFGFCAPAFAEDVKLVYPTDAAAIELDNSTPAKRIEPPVREESEQDVVTPLGQVREVLAILNEIETGQADLNRNIATLKSLDFTNLFPLVEKTANETKEIASTVDSVSLSVKSVAAKIDALQKTTENLRATVESVQKTAASVEAIRTSRWTDYVVIAILALILIQLVCKVGAIIVDKIKGRAAKWQEMAAAYELAKQQLAAAKAQTASSPAPEAK